MMNRGKQPNEVKTNHDSDSELHIASRESSISLAIISKPGRSDLHRETGTMGLSLKRLFGIDKSLQKWRRARIAALTHTGPWCI